MDNNYTINLFKIWSTQELYSIAYTDLLDKDNKCVMFNSNGSYNQDFMTQTINC